MRRGGVGALAYSSKLTATLTGATERQLGYWRKPYAGQPPLLVPEYGLRPALYSYRDVVALRMFAKLRGSLSLQRVRRAVAHVEEQLPQGAHLSAEEIRALPDGSAVWIAPDGEYIDVVSRPGQTAIKIVIEELFQGFETATGRFVPDLGHPAPGLKIDPDVRSGWPVAVGTRVPFDLIAGLRSDGLTVDEIRAFYPGVSAEAVQGSEELAHRVEENALAA